MPWLSSSPRPTCRAAAALGLDDLEVFGSNMDPTVVPNVGRGPQHGVANGADDVERLLVAELPFAARARDLARGSRVANIVAASAPRVELSEDPSQRGRAESAHRARGQLEALACALQVALVRKLSLDPSQRG